MDSELKHRHYFDGGYGRRSRPGSYEQFAVRKNQSKAKHGAGDMRCLMNACIPRRISEAQAAGGIGFQIVVGTQFFEARRLLTACNDRRQPASFLHTAHDTAFPALNWTFKKIASLSATQINPGKLNKSSLSTSRMGLPHQSMHAVSTTSGQWFLFLTLIA
jgi:hypothetical protein